MLYFLGKTARYQYFGETAFQEIVPIFEFQEYDILTN